MIDPYIFESQSILNAVVIADGNSYVQGSGHTPFSAYIESTTPLANLSVYNFGVISQTTPQMIADLNAQVVPLFELGVINFILFVEGGNDIYYNGSVADAISNVINYCNIVRNAGFKVIVSTCINRNDTPAWGSNAIFLSKLSVFNNMLIGNSSYYDGVIRPDLESVFTVGYAGGGYDPDLVHPSDIGQQKYATLFEQAMILLTQ